MLSGLISFWWSETVQKAGASHLYGLYDIDCEGNREPRAIVLIHVLQLEQVISYRDRKERGRSPMPDEQSKDDDHERYQAGSFLA